MHRWGFAPLRLPSLGEDFPACSEPAACMSRVCGGLGELGVVDQTQPLVGPSHPQLLTHRLGELLTHIQTPELTGGLRGSLLWSLGQRAGCTQRLLVHQTAHTIKRGGVSRPAATEERNCLLCPSVAPECPAPPHSWHICTSFLLPQSCLLQLPQAISPCQ